MPYLKAAATATDTGVTFVWGCSDCEAAFALERIAAPPTPADYERIAEEFRQHCQQEHPGSPIVELDLPQQNQ
jgi:hypothetical protein